MTDYEKAISDIRRDLDKALADIATLKRQVEALRLDETEHMQVPDDKAIKG